MKNYDIMIDGPEYRAVSGPKVSSQFETANPTYENGRILVDER